MKKSLLIIQVSILMFCVACNRTTETSTGKTINITLKSDEAIPMPTDSIFESVEYLKLETTEESLISDITKMKIVGSKIYILDEKQETILIFDENGKFQKKFKRSGRGHGEYQYISDFDVDEKYLYVAARISNGVLRYDINTLDYVDNIASNMIRGYMIAVNSRYLFVHSGNERSKDLKDFAVIDKNSGELVAKYRDLELEKTGWISSGFTFAEHNDDVYCVIPFYYDIFKMGADNYKPAFSVDFGAENMLPKGVNGFGYYEYDEFRESLPAPFDKPIYGLGNLYVTDKYFYFTFLYLKQYNLVIYSPENGGLRYGRVDGANKMLLTGAIKYISEDDRVVMAKDASRLCDQFKVIKEYNKNFTIPEELLDIKPEDNPVLIFYKVKDE